MRAFLSAFLVSVMLGGCAAQGLDFVRDDRVTITSPADRSLVELPLTITWKVTGFEITGPDGSSSANAGYFGIVFDRSPPKPGETLESLVDDPACERRPACPDDDYLAGIRIFSTSETSFEIERLPDLDPQTDRRDIHEATIVFLDGAGRRIGEAAFSVEFEVSREF